MGHSLALAVWIFGLGNLFIVYPGACEMFASWVLAILIVVHTAETLFVLNRVRQSPEPVCLNVLKSFVFGYFHIRRYL